MFYFEYSWSNLCMLLQFIIGSGLHRRHIPEQRYRRFPYTVCFLLASISISLILNIMHSNCQARGFPQGFCHLFLLMFSWLFLLGWQPCQTLTSSYFFMTTEKKKCKLSVLIHHSIIINYHNHSPHLQFPSLEVGLYIIEI